MNDLSPYIKQGIAYAIGWHWVKISKKCNLDDSISLEEFIRANVSAGSEDIVYASKLIEILGNMCFRIDDFILVIVLRDKKISQKFGLATIMTPMIQTFFSDTNNSTEQYFKDTLTKSWEDIQPRTLYNCGTQMNHILRYVGFKRAFSKVIEPAWKEIATKCHHWALKYDRKYDESGLLPKSIKTGSDTEHTLRLLDKLIRLAFPLNAFIDIIFDTGSAAVITNINELLKNTPTKTTSTEMVEYFSQKYKDWSRIVVGVIMISDIDTTTKTVRIVPDDKYGMTLEYTVHNKSKRVYAICKNDKISIVFIAWKPRSISDLSTICDEMLEYFKLDYLIDMSVCQLNLKTCHKDVVIATKIHSSAGCIPIQTNDISDRYLKDLIQSFNNWTIEQQSNENDIYRKIDKIIECLYHNIDGIYPPTIKSDTGFDQLSDDWSTFITAVRDGKDDRFILRRNPAVVCLSDSYRKQLDQQVSKDGKLTINTDPKIYHGSVLSTHGIHYTVIGDTINEMISECNDDNLRAIDQFGYSVFIHANNHNKYKCPHMIKKRCKQCVSPKHVDCLSVNVVANHYESISDEHGYDYALFIFRKFMDHFTHFIIDLNESPTIPIIE